MLSPIQTRRHFIKKVEFEVIEETHKDGEDEIKFSLKTQKHKNHWHVILGVKFGPIDNKSTSHFKGEIVMEGLFDIANDFPEDKVKDLVKMNGSAILYGAIREMMIILTARSNFGPLELPTIDARVFLNLNKEKKPAKKKAKKATKKKNSVDPTDKK